MYIENMREVNEEHVCFVILFLEDVVVLKRTVWLRCVKPARRLLCLLGLLGQEHSLDVRQHTTLGDGHTGQELVQLLVVADGQLEMTGDDPRLLVVTGSISCQLQYLSGEVLHHGCEVHGGTGTDALGIVALAKVTMDTSHGELQTGTG